MYPQMNYDGEKPLDTLTLDIYPSGKSSYQLYEDDGKTRAYKQNEFAITNISCNQTSSSTIINIDAIKGSYANMLPQRNYVLQYSYNKKTLIQLLSIIKNFHRQQYHYSNEKNGLLVIDCGKFDVKKKVEVIVK